MYYGVKNCYYIWNFALGGCPIEEAIGYGSLLLNMSDLSLGLSIFSCALLYCMGILSHSI